MKFKKFLPFENFNLRTNLTKAEVLDRITNNIEPKKTFQFSFFPKKRTKPYEGKIIGNSFEISRIIYYRNSFVPFIKGSIHSDDHGTEIAIAMRLFTSVIIFTLLWFGAAALICIGALVAAFVQSTEGFQHGAWLVVVIPFSMIIFLHIMIRGAFKMESIQSKKFLMELLEAKEY